MDYTCQCYSTTIITAVYYNSELENEGVKMTDTATIKINDRKKKAEKSCKSKDNSVTKMEYILMKVILVVILLNLFNKHVR